jgi:hypothetical protein
MHVWIEFSFPHFRPYLVMHVWIEFSFLYFRPGVYTDKGVYKGVQGMGTQTEGQTGRRPVVTGRDQEGQQKWQKVKKNRPAAP